jgi:DNA-binding NarL/FixJ family response regulator
VDTSGFARSTFSVLEKAAIDELDETPAQLTRLERLLIAAIVEIGRMETAAPAESAALPHFDGLTNRENDVLRLIVDGHTNKSAAQQLGISDRTVEVHRMRILKKLGVRSGAELIRAVTDAAAMKAPLQAA